MKIKRAKKFDELDYHDSWQQLGRELFNRVESGAIVEIKDPPKHLIDGGYVQEIKTETKNNGY